MAIIRTNPDKVNTSQDLGLTQVRQLEDRQVLEQINYNISNPLPLPNNYTVNQVTNVINTIIQTYPPQGANGEIQINENGQLVGDGGLTYEPDTDTLTTGSIVAGNIIIDGVANLGNIETLVIHGGASGDILTTNGLGLLHWSTPSGYPSITGKNNKFLVTDGNEVSWSVQPYTSFATTTYVSDAISDLVNSAPSTLNTLNELANALANDSSFSTTVSSALGNRLRIDTDSQNLTNLQKANAITNLGLATVANTGNYTDLTNKPTLVSNLDSLTDVAITSATTGQVLKYNGTNWVNGTDNAGTTIGNLINTSGVTIFGEVRTKYKSTYGVDGFQFAVVDANFSNADSSVTSTGYTHIKGILAYTDPSDTVGYIEGMEISADDRLDVFAQTIQIDTDSSFSRAGSFTLQSSEITLESTSTTNRPIYITGNLNLTDAESKITSNGNITITSTGVNFAEIILQDFEGVGITAINPVQGPLFWNFTTDGRLYTNTNDIQSEGDISLYSFGTDENGSGAGEIDIRQDRVTIWSDWQNPGIPGLGVKWEFANTGILHFPTNTTANVVSAIVIDNANSEMRIGTDTGSISIWPEDSKWLFGANGNLTLANNATIIAPADNDLTLVVTVEYNICTLLTGGSGYGGGGSSSAISGGSGTGMMVGYGYGLSGQVVNVSVTTPGTGYVDGDILTMTAGSGATFVITRYNSAANPNTNTAPADWTFGTDGNLTLPTNTSKINYANGTSILSGLGAGGGIALTDISVGADNSASGGGNVSYNSATGVFTYTPPVIPDVTGFLTSVPTTLDNSSAGDMDVMVYDGNIKYTSNVTIDVSSGNLKAKLFIGNLTLPAGGDILDSTGTSVLGGAGGNPFDQDLNTTNSVTFANVQVDGNVALGLVSRINSGGFGVTNSAEFGTDVTLTGPTITGSEIFMGAGTAESRAIVNSDGNSLIYIGVEDPGFAGMVAIDPGVTNDYAIQVGANNHIEIGAVAGTITTTEYVVGLGVINNTGNINGIFANANVAVIGVGDIGWKFDDNGIMYLPGDDQPSKISFSEAQGAYISQGMGEIDIRTGPGADLQIQTDGGANYWTFGSHGNLTLPQGTILSETATTTVITPPGISQTGQSLVIRPTGAQGITSDRPGGFTDGDTITLTVTPDYNSTPVTGTVDFEFTGCTSIELGRALTGTLTFTSDPFKLITWTIPVSSTMTTFTITLSNASGFSIAGLSPFTLTTSGSTEVRHIHLIAGDPSTTDIYLGDDDQYIKIERNGGNVLIGTDENNNQWKFDTDGGLTLPGGLTFPNDYYIGPGEGSLGISSPDAVAIIANAGMSSNLWLFGTDGNLTLPESGYIKAVDNTKLRLRSSNSVYGETSIEFVSDPNGVIPYNTKVAVGGGGARIQTAGDTLVWHFDNDGKLSLPNNGAGDGVIYSEYANVSLYTNKSGDAQVKIRAKGSTGDNTWAFRDDASILFPDSTTQTTAYRNTPQRNLNIEGGSASTVFEFDMTYVDCGGSYLRGILSQDTYDGSEGQSTPTIDKILDGGQS